MRFAHAALHLLPLARSPCKARPGQEHSCMYEISQPSNVSGHARQPCAVLTSQYAAKS